MADYRPTRRGIELSRDAGWLTKPPVILAALAVVVRLLALERAGGLGWRQVLATLAAGVVLGLVLLVLLRVWLRNLLGRRAGEVAQAAGAPAVHAVSPVEPHSSPTELDDLNRGPVDGLNHNLDGDHLAPLWLVFALEGLEIWPAMAFGRWARVPQPLPPPARCIRWSEVIAAQVVEQPHPVLLLTERGGAMRRFDLRHGELAGNSDALRRRLTELGVRSAETPGTCPFRVGDQVVTPTGLTARVAAVLPPGAGGTFTVVVESTELALTSWLPEQLRAAAVESPGTDAD
jgi:hypothetical protein